MKLKKIFLSTLALTGALTLGACSKNEVTVTNFQTVNQSYNQDEDVSFLLMLDVPNTYRVDSAVISSSLNETFTMKAETSDYISYTLKKTTSDSTVKYDGVSFAYYLKKVSYYDDKNVKHELETSNTARINLDSNKDTSGISVNSLTVTDLKTNENNQLEFDGVSDINIKVDLNNPNKYTITALNFVFTDDQGETQTIKKNLVGNATSGSNISLTLDAPDFVGAVTLKLDSIEYDNKKAVKTISAKTTPINFKFAVVDSTLTSLSISDGGDYNTNAVYDREDVKSVAEGQTVYLNATFSIPENSNIQKLTDVTIKSSIIDAETNQEKEVSARIVSSSIYMKSIKAVISFTTTDTNLNVRDYTISKFVVKTKNNNVTYKVSSAKQEQTKISLKTYKRVIRTQDDYIKLQNAGTTLTGTNLVAISNGINFRSATITNSLNLDGYLIYSKGSTIKAYTGSVPLFNTISNKSILDGLVIDSNCRFDSTGLGSSFVCKTNNGVIKNAKLDNLKISVSNKHVNEIGLLLANEDAVFGTNNGQIKNVSMQHLVLTVNHPENHTESIDSNQKSVVNYSTLVYKNTGTISNVVVSYAQIANAPKDRDVNLFVRENTGTIQNSWIGMFFSEEFVGGKYSIHFTPNGNGAFNNIFANEPSLEVSKTYLQNEKLQFVDISNVNTMANQTAIAFWESLNFTIIKGNFGWQLSAQGIDISI